MPLNPGDLLGPYEIVAPIGAGGMGAVYKARDPRLNRFVAIKVLPPDKSAHSERNQRFLQEARAASALNHRHIVSIYDIGQEGEATYLVMELVEGQPLEKAIPRNGMRLGEVLRIGSQIADAFSKAHQIGIVHRDLKPANVMLTIEGSVKVLDFGLAKLMEPTAAQDDRTLTQMAHTQEGTVMGTPAYMSPEQAEGKVVDARSDIFSFGAVLYELVTGQRAFSGGSTASTLAAVLNHEPKPAAEIRSDLPIEFSRLITRCLRKDPARRAQSMADLRVALDELREDAESGRLSGPVPAAVAASAERPRRRAIAAWAIAALALAAAGTVGWRIYEGRRVPDAPLQPVELTNYPGLENSPTFSPDGKQVAFSWTGEQETNVDIYVKIVGVGSPLRLTNDPRPEIRPAWSPDGRHIAYLQGLDANLGTLGVMIVPPLGGAPRKLMEIQGVPVPGGYTTSLDWTPDSRYILVAGTEVAAPEQGNRVMRISVDTGDVRTVTKPKERNLLFAAPRISPDGETIALLAISGSVRLVFQTLTSGWEASGETRTTPAFENATFFDWAANGQSLVVGYGNRENSPLYRIPLAGGPAVPLTWTGPGATAPTVNRPGARLAYTRQIRDTNIWRLPLTAGSSEILQKVASSTFRDVAPQYSPKGDRIAFHSNRSGAVEIWTAASDGSGATQLTQMGSGATTGTPRWSPDGRRISFDSAASGTYQIYVIDAEGGRPRMLTNGPHNSFVSCWSSDGRWIYFGSNRSDPPQLWRVPSGGGNTEQVTTQGGDAPQIGPDGKWIYFAKRQGRDGLWRMPIEGGEETRLAESVYRYNFAPGLEGIYYSPQPIPQGKASIRYLDFKTNRVREIHQFEKTMDLGLALSPDSRYLLFTQMDYVGSDLLLVEGFR